LIRLRHTDFRSLNVFLRRLILNKSHPT